MGAPQFIHIHGARVHNLKDVEVRLPRGKLVVITGVSGSGKSSLAFDTLYAEGHRQYLDSLSPRMRAMLEQLPRPDVDFIHGLSPVIAVEQHAGSSGGSRSTVATATEIDDYARLIWLHLGKSLCPQDGSPIVERTLDDCLARLLEEPEGTRAIMLAPLYTGKKSVLREELPRLRQRGFQRVRIDGEIVELDGRDPLSGTGSGACTLELVVDRVVLRADQRSRLADSLELAFGEGQGRALVLLQAGREAPWQTLPLRVGLASTKQGNLYEPLTSKHLSANHPLGACPKCGGLGDTLQFSPELMVPDPSLSVKSGAFKALRIGSKKIIIRNNALLKQLAEQLPFDPETPWQDLPEPTRAQILYGTGDEREFEFRFTRRKTAPKPVPFAGVVAELQRSVRETSSSGFRARMMAYQTRSLCPQCKGTRLSPRAQNVFVEGLPLPQFFSMSVARAHVFIKKLQTGAAQVARANEAITRLEQQLYFLQEVGLGYLGLERVYSSLSGGEAQRVRLASQLGVGLSGVAYVLDEPSIGLHPADHKRLIASMQALRERGNSLIVVEHDEETMRVADHLVELGPGAGEAGGRVLFEGTVAECEAHARSRTGAFLSGRARVERDVPLKHPQDDAWLTVHGGRAHNLQNVTVSFPVGLLTVVCGVSGSGKSTLVNDILANAAAMKLQRAKTLPEPHERITGLEHFASAVRVDQSPIGRSPRSNPATYVKLFDPLRQLFAKCPLARVRGYTASRFSFNVRGGRCERCQGDGQIKLDMHFLDDVYASCPSCHGQRYNRETLEVRFKGKHIAEVLEMTVDEARGLFAQQPLIAGKLERLASVGLGYLRLGQPSQTLSGGEAQRIKLALELSKRTQGQTLYVLDEPTTGLHWDDVQKLMDLLFALRDAGNTVLLIEHHMDVVRLADYVVELGPGGGEHGGQLVYAGDVRGMAQCKDSPTGRFLGASRAVKKS